MSVYGPKACDVFQKLRGPCHVEPNLVFHIYFWSMNHRFSHTGVSNKTTCSRREHCLVGYIFIILSSITWSALTSVHIYIIQSSCCPSGSFCSTCLTFILQFVSVHALPDWLAVVMSSHCRSAVVALIRLKFLLPVLVQQHLKPATFWLHNEKVWKNFITHCA